MMIKVVATFSPSTTLTTGFIHWPGQTRKPPKDVPLCGFTGNNPFCKIKSSKSSVPLTVSCNNYNFFLLDISSVYAGVGLGLLILLTITVTFTFHFYRRVKFESELSSLWWKVKYDDIKFENEPVNSHVHVDQSSRLSENDKLGLRKEESSKRKPSWGIPDPDSGVHLGVYRVGHISIVTQNFTFCVI